MGRGEEREIRIFTVQTLSYILLKMTKPLVTLTWQKDLTIMTPILRGKEEVLGLTLLEMDSHEKRGMA